MREFLAVFFEYLLGFLDKWFFWIGIAMLLGELLEKYVPAVKARLEKLVPVWAFASLALICFFLATFQVWHKEYEKTHPGLRLSLNEWGFAEHLEGQSDQGPVPLINTPGTPAIVVATIRNLGFPSVADNWGLSISIPGRKEIINPRLMDFTIKNNPLFYIEGDAIPMSKLLYRQTLVPISQGDKKQGLLAFFVDGISIKELAQRGTKITLTCEDVAGNTISSETVELTGQNRGHQHFLGLEK